MGQRWNQRPATLTSLGAALATALIASLAATSAWASPAADLCNGKNVLPDLAKEKPELYARIESAAAKVPNGEAMLWRVSRRGRRPSHLLGTMHTSDPRIATLTPNIERVLLGAKTVAVEIAVFSRIGFVQYMQENRGVFMYTDGSKLAGKLSPDELAAAAAAIKRARVPEPIASAIRPWFAYFLLRQRSCEALRKAKGWSHLDQIIADEARNNRIPVVGLETVAEQLQAFASLSDETQIDILKSALKTATQPGHVRQSENHFETMVNLYLDRKINMLMPMTIELSRAASQDPTQHEEFERVIGTKRNYVMLERSLPFIEKGGALVAVGALHLVGKEGLVALYRKAGYQVTPVE